MGDSRNFPWWIVWLSLLFGLLYVAVVVYRVKRPEAGTRVCYVERIGETVKVRLKTDQYRLLAQIIESDQRPDFTADLEQRQKEGLLAHLLSDPLRVDGGNTVASTAFDGVAGDCFGDVSTWLSISGADIDADRTYWLAVTGSYSGDVVPVTGVLRREMVYTSGIGQHPALRGTTAVLVAAVAMAVFLLILKTRNRRRTL